MLRHRLMLALLAFALFLRVLVPAGWMPASHGGAFAIEPCPAAAAPSIHAAQHQHHGGEDHQSHRVGHDGDCAFAPLLAGFAAADLAPSLPAPMPIAGLPATPLAAATLKTGPPALPPPATGPPRLA
jgi:hypothetical protein